MNNGKNVELTDIISWYKSRMFSILKKSQKKPYLVGTIDILEKDLLSAISEEISNKILESDLSNIKDKNKLSKIVSTLCMNAASQVRDMIGGVQSNMAYDRAKEVLKESSSEKYFLWIKSQVFAYLNHSKARALS